MRIYTATELKEQFSKLGYIWPEFHLIGIRSKENKPNVFDDSMYVCSRTTLVHMSCTTNPGTYWLQNLMSKSGAAVLKPGQYLETWKLGMHHVYEALVQAKPVIVYRDNDKDNLAEEQGILETGMFGLNIHRANEKLTSVIIDKWSAGCQVVNNPKMFNFMLESCKASGNKLFTYTLLREF